MFPPKLAWNYLELVSWTCAMHRHKKRLVCKMRAQQKHNRSLILKVLNVKGERNMKRTLYMTLLYILCIVVKWLQDPYLLIYL